MNNISEHISFSEATKSQDAVRKGIDNIPNEQQLNKMKLVADKCFEPLRKWWGKPIGISSFFRSPELNKSIGGSTTSGHCLGEAIDIDADIFNNGITNKEIFLWLKENVKFNELIWEFGDDNNPAWVHILYREDDNKGEILRAIKDENGKSKYLPFK